MKKLFSAFVLVSLILNTAFSQQFKYKLIIEDDDMEKAKQKLSTIGIANCKQENENTLVCIKSNDLNALARIRDYLEKKGLNAKVVENANLQEEPKTKNTDITDQKITPSVKQNHITKNYRNKQCIQILTSDKVPQKDFEKVKNFPLARVEKIGSLYVLRVGIADRIADLKPILRKVRKDFPSAFIRRCDLIKDRVVVSSQNKTSYVASNKKEKAKSTDTQPIGSFIQVSPKIKNPVEDMYNALNSGNLVKAQQLANKLKNNYKYSKDAYKVLGIIYMKKGQEGKACRTFDNLYKKYKEPDIKNLRKESCYIYAQKMGYKTIEANPDLSIKYFQKSLEFKDSLDAKIGIGYALLNKDENEKAYNHFKNLYQKYPNNKKVVEGYILSMLKLKKYDEIRELDKKLSPKTKKHLNDKIVYIKLSQIEKLIQEGNLDEAEKQALDLYTSNPDNTYVLLILGKIYTEKKEYEKAKQYYKNVLILEPENVYALEGLKGIYIIEKKYSKALAITEKQKQLGLPVDDEEKIRGLMLIEQAKKEYSKENYDEALELAEKAYKTNPDNPEVLMLLGDIYYKKNQPDKAYKYYASAYKQNKQDFDLKMRFLYALLNLELFEQIKAILATTDVESLDEHQKNKLRMFYKDLYLKSTYYYLEKKEYKMSKDLSEEGLSMFENEPKLLNARGWSCYQLKDYECAEKSFKLTLKNTKDEKEIENAKLGLAYIYLNNGEKQKARKYLSSIEDTNDIQTKQKVIDAYIALGDIDKADILLKQLQQETGIIVDEDQIIQEEETSTYEEKNIEKQQTIIPNPFLQKKKTVNSEKSMKIKTKIRQKKSKKTQIRKEIYNLKQKIKKAKMQNESYVSVGFKYRYRSGQTGLSKLSIFTPFIASKYYFNQRWFTNLGIYYPFISSGGNPPYNEFGSINNPVIRDTDTKVSGFEGFLGIGYKNKISFYGQIGTTPITNEPDVNSAILWNLKVSYSRKSSLYSLSFYRENEKNTLLSYTGAKDPHSTNGWGRVLDTGLRFEYENILDKEDSIVHLKLQYGSLKGKNTEKNNRFWFEIYPNFYSGNDISDKDYLGLFLIGLFNSKDQNQFYFGSGGYYSPRYFFMIAPSYEGNFWFNENKGIINTKLMLGLQASDNWDTEGISLSFDMMIATENLLSDHWSIFAGLDFRKAFAYTEFFAIIGFNYYFFSKTSIKRTNILTVEKEMIK